MGADASFSAGSDDNLIDVYDEELIRLNTEMFDRSHTDVLLKGSVSQLEPFAVAADDPGDLHRMRPVGFAKQRQQKEDKATDDGVFQFDRRAAQQLLGNVTAMPDHDRLVGCFSRTYRRSLHFRRVVGESERARATRPDDLLLALGYPQKTIFDELTEAGVEWRSYYSDFPLPLFFKSLRDHKFADNYRQILEFHEDAAKGALPPFSYLDPGYFHALGFPATDQHPSHPVNAGEQLMKDVYESLRNSPAWNETLLIITYDEHGGFYDHVPPPMQGIPNPDGLDAPQGMPAFNFTRLGIRVPFILVSPWLDRGAVQGAPAPHMRPTPTSHFDHTSVLSFLKDHFGLPAFLTKRDAWAASFSSLFGQRSAPRTDAPATLPPVYTQDHAAMENHGPSRHVNDLQRVMLRTAVNLMEHHGHIGDYGRPITEPFNYTL